MPPARPPTMLHLPPSARRPAAQKLAAPGVLLSAALLGAAVVALAWRPPSWGVPVMLPLAWTGGLLVLALAVLLLARGWRRSAGTLAVLVLLAGCAALTAELGQGTLSGPLPGDVPAVASFGAVLMGTATALLAWGAAGPLAGHITRACAGTALLVAAVGWLETWWLETPRLFPVAVPNASAWLLIVFAMLAAALFLLVRDRPTDPALRHLDQCTAWCPALLAGLFFIAWTHLQEQEWHERAVDTGQALTSVATDVGLQLEARARGVLRLAQHEAAHGEAGQPAWERDAVTALREDPALLAVQRVDGDGRVLGQVTAVASRFAPRPVPQWSDAGTLAALRAARSTGQVRLAPALQLPGGGHGLLFVAPPQGDAAAAPQLATLVRVDELLALAQRPILHDFSVALRDGDRLIAGEGARPPAASAGLLQRAQFDALGQPWTLEAWPKPGYLQRMRSRLADALLLLGLPVVGLVAAAFLQARRSLANSIAARDIAARLSATLESISDAFVTLDAQGRFTYVNREAERLLQRPRAALLGRAVREAFPDGVGSTFEGNYLSALRERRTISFEAHYAPLDAWFGMTIYPTREGAAVYFREVSELRRGREALRESERELRALAESLPQLVWMCRPDGEPLYVNRRWTEYTGLALAQSEAGRWLERVHPEDRPALRQAWATAMDQGHGFSLQCRLQRSDGAWRWMLVRAVAIDDGHGQVRRWLGTGTDIDEIHRAAETLQLSEERFRLLARTSGDAVFDHDLRTGTTWWSDNFETLFGPSPTGVATLSDWAERIHPEERQAVESSLQQALDAGRDQWTAECRLRRGDGRWARIHARGHVLRDASGQATRMIGALSDVTERVQLEEQLRQSQRLEAVGQLTGGVAHDFNNLLTVIVGNAEALEEELAGQPSLQPLAAMVLTAAERGAQLTQRLLAFARKQALAPVPVDVPRLLKELEPLLRGALGERIRMGVECTPDLWQAMVDPTQLDNALLNLAVNARDAMPSGGTLRIQAANATLDAAYTELHPDVQPGDYVCITVTDTGSGIAPEHADHLFEPFFTTKEVGRGTGLGLPMVYGFVKQSGGQVSIASELGVGTTVTLYLPRATQQAQAPVAGPGPLLREGRGAVLLVEDDALVRSSARRQLEELGYQVSEAAGGEEALALLAGPQPVDLLFTDVVMPGLAGPQLVERARALRPGLRVLYTSGYAEDAVLHPGRLDEGVDLLAKPYTRQQLAQRVREALAAPA